MSVCDEGCAYVGVNHATLLRRWVHVGDRGSEPSVCLDASVISCDHGQINVLGACWLLPTSSEARLSG